LNTTALLPEKGPWPPKNFKEFYNWITDSDPTAAKTLFKLLGTKEGAHSPILILLETVGGIVGIEVSLAEGLLSSTKLPSRFKKQLVMDDGHLGTKFCRIIFDDLSQHYQTTRNLVNTRAFPGNVLH